MSSNTKNNRFLAAYGGKIWDNLTPAQQAEVVAFDATVERTEQKPTLDDFLKHDYDPAGNAFEETFAQWARRVSAGYSVPVVLFFLAATTILVVIVASR